MAPDFTAPLAHGNDGIGSFTLSNRLDEAPIVLAFFGSVYEYLLPRDERVPARLSAFEDAGATIYGVSVDFPFSQNAFREQLDLKYGLISDANREIIEKYGVSMDWDEYGLNARSSS